MFKDSKQGLAVVFMKEGMGGLLWLGSCPERGGGLSIFVFVSRKYVWAFLVVFMPKKGGGQLMFSECKGLLYPCEYLGRVVGPL